MSDPISPKLAAIRPEDAASIHCMAGVYVDGSTEEHPAILQFVAPNVISEIRKDADGHVIMNGDEVKVFEREINSVEVRWRHAPCEFCRPFRDDADPALVVAPVQQAIR